MLPILSLKLLPNRNSDGVGTFLVRGSSFGGKTLDKHCLLILFHSIFSILRKVQFSMQMLMKLDNSGLWSLPELSLLLLLLLLLLRFIR